jgi:hypothetical protein
MMVKVLLSTLVFALLLPILNAQDHPANMGVVVKNTEDNADKSFTTVHLVNMSGKEVTAFSLSVKQTLPDGKTFTSSANSYDLLGQYLFDGKAFSPNSTYDALVGRADGTTLVVDVVIYADGTAQVQNQERFKDMIDKRKVHFQALETVDEAIEKVLADPAAEHPTASVAAQLKAVLDDEEKKADLDNKRNVQGNTSPSEFELGNQIRNLTRYVNRNEEAPLDEMLQHNKSEIAKLTPHVQVTEIQQ